MEEERAGRLGSLVAQSIVLVFSAGQGCFIDGASGFLGRTFADTLLTNGADLIAVGRQRKLSKQEEVWTAKYGPGRVHSYYVDMYDLEALAKTLDEVAQRHAVDVLVYNAHELAPASGFQTPAGSLEQGTMEVWMRIDRWCLLAGPHRAENWRGHERPWAWQHH